MPRPRTIVVSLAAAAVVAGAVAVVVAPGCNRGGTSGTGTTDGQPADYGPPWFEDVTAAGGVAHTYRNGEEAGHLAIPESLGGGVAVVDFDRDGRPDLFFPGGGKFEGKTVVGLPPKLYRNLGNFKFEDVTKQVGLDAAPLYSHAAAVGDYDRDGWPDLVVTGWGRVYLYHNEPDGQGGRKFVEVGAKAGFAEHLWANSAAWVDLDGDGFPELYVCQYGDWSFEKNHPTDCVYVAPVRDVCPPRRFKPLPHKLYKNNRDGTFADVTNLLNQGDGGRGLGAVAVDINNDQKPDVYATNDNNPKFLFVNRTAGGKLVLEEKGKLAGVAFDDRGEPNGSMGVDAADYAGNGRAGLWCTNYEGELHALYLNDTPAPGRERFRFATKLSGVAAIGQMWVGWGTAFADFDHHGSEDLVVANGHAIRFPQGKTPRRQPPVLFRNDGTGHFDPITPTAGPYFREPHNARGLVAVDLDNDGKLDLVITHVNEPAVVLRNVAPSAGNHWVGFELAGADRRDLAGSRVVLTAGGKTRTRFVKGGGSYASAPDTRIHFGLGAAEKIDKVEVFWSWKDGSQVVEGVTADRYWKVTEGDPKPADPKYPK